MRPFILGIVAASLAASSGAVARAQAPPIPIAGAADARAPLVIPRLTGAVVLDGPSDEAAWAAVPPLPVAMQTPTFGQAPSERTEFRVAHDDRYLYAAGRLYDADVAGIRATSLRRDDNAFTNDWFVVNLDSFNDKENTLVFGTTPAGVRTDLVFTNDGGRNNFDWNTVWDAAVRQTPEGWFAEIRVPLSSLRFEERDGRVVMGMTVWRRIARKNEMVSFPAIEPRWGTFSVFKASQAQEVVLEGVHARTPVYLTPYVLGGAGHTHAVNAARNAYVRADRTVRDAGLDVKLGVTSNLTLDLTYNTDFAQVEADDQQVNLSRFSLFFPEKRSFFQERASVFDFTTGGDDRLFYSRRVGLASGRAVPVEGGARLVGRVAGWDVGLLGMATQRLDALPAERFGVARVRRQVLNENSYVGGLVTSREGGGRRNLVVAADAIVRLRGQDFLLVNAAHSDDRLPPAATSAVVPAERDLDDVLGRVRLERRGLDGFTYALDAARIGARFQPGLGFLARQDFMRVGDRVSYGWRPGAASPLLRHTAALRATAYRRNGDGRTESSTVGPEWVVETKRGHQVTLAAASQYEHLAQEFRLSDAARVPAGRYRFQTASVAYTAPQARLLRANASLDGGAFYDGWQASATVSPTWNLSRHLELGGSLQRTEIALPDRDQRFRATISRLRARVMLDTRLSAAAFLQHNSAADVGSANVRLRWNPREGTDLYVVYNEGLNTDRAGYLPVRPLSDARTLLVKYARMVDVRF